MIDEALSRVRDQSFIARVTREVPSVEIKTAAADDAFERGVCDTLETADFETVATSKDDMYWLYDQAIARDPSGGRPRYDELVLASNRICPYCDQQRATSIDHYLPRARFWALAASPINLVPACHDCNHTKGDYYPGATRPALLHPYYDDLADVAWLTATISNSGDLPSARYSVDVAAVPDPLRGRVLKHFAVFRLADMYATYAGQAIDNLSHEIPSLRESTDVQTVVEHLKSEAVRRAPLRVNHWERVLLNALAADRWFTEDAWRATVVAGS